MSAETVIQGALFSALSGVGLSVVDSAQQNRDGSDASAFPYVEVGFVTIGAFDTAGETGFDYVARIHTRSRSASMKEAKLIQGQIYDRLHRGALTLVGYLHVLIQRERSEIIRASDGSFHGVCEYRGLIEKQP
ncbi:MAG: hypothetical protein A3D16_12145 [Rhodobacterales bacterium RIFCSPHIGHO2_02_FULL_62_130]|nr:MAG: hypothetical protein A3D16_12145 [Rhodobacterales bacterium RIFCSPHIGHO2_02_FULL_62_130]OHC53854.1 MAG: hypothetical protein A3E48_23165 [Rhodobacterales bacterium RIFCSPHIGHO2_12_FULL_62_75]HCZ00177.1 hypothetical protein [Rhodobacter sp.]